MAELLHKCGVCHALLDEEDIFCVNCGTEAPDHPDAGLSTSFQSTHNFNCEGCGASMSYDASARNLRCPFCGSEKMHAERDVKVLKPQWVVPFATAQADAQKSLHRFMGSSFWRPSDLATSSVIVKMRPIYVPYWVFSATARTHWTADTSKVPPGARASWYPMAGEHSAHYQNILVGASGALTPAETNALLPFNMASGVRPEEIDLENVTYEPFRVQRKYARPHAIHGFEEAERTACRALVPGSARNVRVAVLLEGLRSWPVLLPIWIMAYQYRGKVYRFLVNGQTGRHHGQAPFSYWKALLVAGITIAAIVLLALFLFVCMGAFLR
jgi:hypothetical protein